MKFSAPVFFYVFFFLPFLPGLTPMSCGGCPLGKQPQKCAWVKRRASQLNIHAGAGMNETFTNSHIRKAQCVCVLNQYLINYFDLTLCLSKGWTDPKNSISMSWFVTPKSIWIFEPMKLRNKFPYVVLMCLADFFSPHVESKKTPPHCFEAAKNWRLVLGNQSVALSEIRSTSMLSPTFLVTWSNEKWKNLEGGGERCRCFQK